MTPPCTHCHGARGTTSLDEALPEAPPCPAETRWPEWIRSVEADLPRQEWWVRSNFEAAREPRRALRFDVGRAELAAEIRLRPGYRDFAGFPWSGSPYRALGVEISSGASLTSRLEVRDNALRLGLRNLVAIDGIYLDGPLGFNFWPERVSVGDYGELHAIARTEPGVLFFLDPFMVPRPPLGRDLPAGDQWEAVAECLARPADADGGAADCYPAATYPNHRDNPRIDYLLTRFIPAELREPNGRLPSHFDLETLIARLLDWRRARSAGAVPAAPDSRGPLSRARATLQPLQEWLEPGSRVELDVARLNDLFLPGLLDLGPSRGTFEVVYRGGQAVTAESRDLEINLDPMDFPARPGPTRPSIRLETATLAAAAASAELDGIETPPGLRVEFDAATGNLWMEGNLALSAQARLPGLGEVELDGQLLLRSAWRLSDTGLEPVPESTVLEFRNGELWEAGGHRPLLTEFSLTLSDGPEAPEGLAAVFRGPSAEPRARLALSGWLGRARRLELTAAVPLPLRLDAERYDLEALLQNLSAEIALQLNGSHSYATEVALRSSETGGGNGRSLSLDFDLREGENGGPARRHLIREGHLELRSEREFEGHDHYFADFRAAAIDRGPVVLRGVEGELAVDRLQFQDGVSQVRVPRLRLSLNPHGAPGGILRGPVSLLLEPSAGGALNILWHGPERRLDVTGLDLRFQAAGLRVLPRVLLDLLNPSVAGIGLDGHFEGGFTAEFPEDRREWRARGDLRLRGDRDGDIYLMDTAGRRVGLPLVRDTRWRWRRVDRIDWRRRYALGDFHLDTLLNFAELLPRGARLEGAATEAATYGARGQALRPYEINGVMPYDNQPWDLEGFRNRIVDYLLTLCRQNAECRAGMEGERNP
ncbi:MAG: hypothetical protein IT572_04545 [Deltaproteobacteria bacterium]|nr:hypothetical protein [Deltaproteobacteria bacterium]